MNKGVAGLKIGFLFGMLCFWFLQSMLQDLMGKESYLEYVNKNWVNTSPVMWLIFLLLTLMMMEIVEKKFKE